MQILISSVDNMAKLTHPSYTLPATPVLVVIHMIAIIVWTGPFDYFLIHHIYFITEYKSYCNQLGVLSSLSHAVQVEGHGAL